MTQNIVIISVDKRTQEVPKIQEILTKYGCNIKVRLGLHDFSHDACSQKGLIILELVSGQNENNAKLVKELESVSGLIIKFIKI